MVDKQNQPALAATVTPRTRWSAVLRALRDAAGLPQQAWADFLGVGRGTVRRWESGEAVPNAVAERALLTYCHERSLFRVFTAGPLAELTLTPERLGELLAEARLSASVEPDRRSTPGPSASPAADVPRSQRPDRVAEPGLPSGTVTFLFTDIEGSSRLWDLQLAAMPTALARHFALLQEAITAHGGQVFKTVGDAVCAAFATAPAALHAAIAVQRALAAEIWATDEPLRARIAVHTGTADERNGDYFGPDLNRVTRLRDAGYGGQILLSTVAAGLVRGQLPEDIDLRDLGVHRLRDLTEPEHVYQIAVRDLPADFPPLCTDQDRRSHLPAALTSFVGRARELATVARLLAAARLVTLTGPGGVGKTRLAQAVAERVDAAFPDGVVFVDLAPISDPNLVVGATARALGVADAVGRTPSESLREFLRARSLLLVLDNFEQVLAASPLVSELLKSCPHLRVLVTSRAVLHLSGEHEFSVPPLGLPEATEGVPLELAGLYPAVRLFVERARLSNADFALTAENVEAVVAICRRLDGLPLAIELAAARSKLLTPQALLERLERSLTLLTGGPRDIPARQQRLRDTIAWSYDLLDEDERMLFRRLSVFVGGCTLEAVAAVCADGGAPDVVLDAVTSLVDKSLLVQRPGPEGRPRVRMLETIREYGLDHLVLTGEADSVQQRHASFYLSLAEDAEPRLEGPEQVQWVIRLESDFDNLRAALLWSIETQDASAGLRLGGALWMFWQFANHQREGADLLSRLLALPDATSHPTERGRVLYSAGYLAFAQGDYDRARRLLEERLALARALADARATARTRAVLAAVLAAHGEHAAAAVMGEESISTARELNDFLTLVFALAYASEVARAQGDYDRAYRYCAENVEWCRPSGHTLVTAWAIYTLGQALLGQAHLAAAAGRFMESLDLFREQGERRGVAAAIAGLAEIAAAMGQSPRAARLFGHVHAFLTELGMPLEWVDQNVHDSYLASVRTSMTEDEFGTAWATGQALTPEAVDADIAELAADLRAGTARRHVGA